MSLAAADRAKTIPGEMAVTDGRMTLTWAELDPVIDRATNALLAESLGSPPRAAVFAHNSTESALAYLAMLHAGVSGVPANFHLTADELAYILKDSGARLLFVGPETAATGVAAARQVGIERVIGWRCESVEGVTPWDEWLTAASAAAPPTDMKPLPYMHYTSGTTGRPKGTETPPNMFPREPDVAGLFRALGEQVAAGQPGPTILVGPAYHTGPLGSVRQLGGGRPLVVMPKFDAEQILVLIERHRVATSVMVPTHFQRLLALPDEVRAKYDVSSLRLVSHTGAACPVDCKRAMIDWWGPVLLEAYGATEAGIDQHDLVRGVAAQARFGRQGDAAVRDGGGRRGRPRGSARAGSASSISATRPGAGSSITTIRKRPPPRTSSPASSPWARSATSTRTATSSSPIARRT